ncbi:hypothetical protein Golax_003249 [Gossypium laxum]|uniref:Uncharacterized protein n=1 Tax=Gossypium laxum TaxID=34288 RepID=A0A7J9AEU5_9ROSI|nr:hypothetical protein [Gossypium laxum]
MELKSGQFQGHLEAFYTWKGSTISNSKIRRTVEEHLTALQARLANHRNEFLQKGSLVRQQQYQQPMMNYHPHSSVASANTMPTDNISYGYGSVAGSAAIRDGQEGYNSDNFDN